MERFAVQALEQICDERTLIPRLCRYLYGDDAPFWEVTILSRPSGEARFKNKTLAVERDKSLALAICKALARLGEKGNDQP